MKNRCKDLIRSDLYRYIGKYTFKDLAFHYITNPGFRYMFNHRKCNFYKNKNKMQFLFYRINLNRLKYKYGYEISSNAEIDSGFYIGHLGPIIINPKAKLGKNINISSGVTIGQQNRGKYKGFPTISENVWIGANSIIVGSITIGTNVLIAPGSYINYDVPDNSIVIGNPAIIKSNEDATDGYLQYKV